MIKTKTKKSEYDLFSKLYREWWDEDGQFKVLHEIRPLRIEYILSQIGKKDIKDCKILDLGCGGGLVCESLTKLGAKVTGIDFVKDNIDIAKTHANKNNLKINYIHGDIDNLNISKKFDVIILFEVLEHLDDWRDQITNIKKNINKNGLLIISTINRNLFSKIFAIDIAEKILKWIPSGTHDIAKLIKPEELKYHLSEENFNIKDTKGLTYNPITSDWSLSNNTLINYFCTAVKN